MCRKVSSCRLLDCPSFVGIAPSIRGFIELLSTPGLAVAERKDHGVSVERDLGDGGTGIDGNGPRPDDQMNQDERATQLHAALNRLSDEHRLILVLREMDGLSYEDISEILEAPVGTVRSRLHRARTQLKDELATYFESKN